jgi:hypothetical protein
MRLFDKAKDSTSFFEFVDGNKFYHPDGEKRFAMQINLITQQIMGMLL